MKVSKKAYYGLRAAIALAQSDKAVSIHALAESEHLPEDYLEKILQLLRKAGMVVATKGVTGGYKLSRSSSEVSAWDILRVLDGPIETFLPPATGTLPCLQVSHCQTNQVWRTLEEKIEETLSDISLERLSHNTH
ncbi:MAG: Rrf2 family transcriptional regulator [Candidatus Moraniibacteriota bacterium]